jgi:hypothetical protein
MDQPVMSQTVMAPGLLFDMSQTIIPFMREVAHSTCG